MHYIKNMVAHKRRVLNFKTLPEQDKKKIGKPEDTTLEE
jgi:hypothetical protein